MALKDAENERQQMEAKMQKCNEELAMANETLKAAEGGLKDVEDEKQRLEAQLQSCEAEQRLQLSKRKKMQEIAELAEKTIDLVPIAEDLNEETSNFRQSGQVLSSKAHALENQAEEALAEERLRESRLKQDRVKVFQAFSAASNKFQEAKDNKRKAERCFEDRLLEAARMRAEAMRNAASSSTFTTSSPEVQVTGSAQNLEKKLNYKELRFDIERRFLANNVSDSWKLLTAHHGDKTRAAIEKAMTTQERQERWHINADSLNLKECMSSIGTGHPNKRYEAAKKKLEQESPDGKVTEIIAFHGTLEDRLNAIAEGGFDDMEIGSQTDPGFWGRGHYFSELPHQCFPFIQPKMQKEDCKSSRTAKLLACKVLIGQRKTLERRIDEAPTQGTKRRRYHLDTHFSPQNKEFVILHQPDQGKEASHKILPLFIISFKLKCCTTGQEGV